MSSHLRQHPRFVSDQKVEVELVDRAELRQLYMSDISKGGMFLQTESPPPHDTELEIKVSTPDGAIRLRGRVVHVVAPEAARMYGQPSGVGVQFVNLSSEVKKKIENHVDGLAARLTADLSADIETEPLEVLLEEARRINAALADSDVYGALGVEPSASTEEIQTRVAELCMRFAYPPRDASPAKAARLAQVAKAIDRASAMFANPLRRLHFDFNRGLTRVDERRAAGEDFAHLRAVWKEAFPERMTKAKEISKRAIEAESARRFNDAASFAKEALELDPFNDELREAHASWSTGQPTKDAAFEGTPLPQLEIDPNTLLKELLQLQKKLPSMTDYEVLGVKENATKEELSRASIELIQRLDPDRLRGALPPSVLAIAAEYRKRVELAFTVLTDPTRRRSAKTAEAAPPPPKTSDANTKNGMGVVFMRKSDYAKARALFKGAMEQEPEIAEYKANYAWTFVVDPAVDRAHAAATARPLLTAAIEATPTKLPIDRKRRARYEYYLGRLLRDEGDFARAKGHFENALVLDPALTEATTELRLIAFREAKKK